MHHHRNATPVAVLVAATLAVGPPTVADEINAVWAPAADGNWSVPENWDPFGVPDNDVDFFNVRIDDDPETFVTVLLNTFVTINSLVVDGGDRLNFANNRRLTVVGGPITNNGVIRLFSNDVFATPLEIDGMVTLQGTGTLIGEGNTGNVIRGVGDTPRLINDTNPITGVMQIGFDSTSVTTRAPIEADVDTRFIILDPPADGDFTNESTVRATGGGRLELRAGLYRNELGTFAATDGSDIRLLTDVIVDGGTVATEGDGRVSVLGVVAFNGVHNTGRTEIGNNRTLRIADSFTNSGTVQVFSNDVFATRLQLDGDLTLDGGGMIELAGNAANRITSLAPDSRLINLDNTIAGPGGIGDDFMSFTTHGPVEATLASQPLSLDPPPAGDVTNASTIRAGVGAVLRLLDGFYDNTAGVFEADDESIVDMRSDVTIDGGELRTLGSGLFQVTLSPVRYQNVRHDARTLVSNRRRLELAGTFENLGDVEIFSNDDFPTRVAIDGDLTLSGGGTVTLNGRSNNLIDALAPGARLTNLDNVIAGAGNIGNDVMSFTTRALVEATSATNALILDPPPAGDVTNEATIRATGGAELWLRGGLYDNTAGTIEADDTSTVEVRTDAVIDGGVLRSSGTGRFQVVSSPARYADVRHEAETLVINRQTLVLEGTFDNAGDVEVNSIDDIPTHLQIDGDLMLTGGGTLTLTGRSNNLVESRDGEARLTNIDNTIAGAGNLGADTMSFTNHGVVDGDQPANVLVIDPPAAGDFTNHGTLMASGAAGVRIGAGPMDNAGLVWIAAGSKLDRTAGDYTQTAGETIVDGELEVDAGVVDLAGGTLGGSGLVDADVVVGPAAVAPGASAGVLTIEGDYLPTADGVLAIELGGLVPGDEHDVLDVSADAILDGTLRLTLIDGFVPQVGDAFVIVTAGSITGVFPCLDALALDDGFFRVTYGPETVTVTVVSAPPARADLDGDGTVGFSDLLVLLSFWGPCEAACCPADFDDNGVVDFNDLLALLSMWG